MQKNCLFFLFLLSFLTSKAQICNSYCDFGTFMESQFEKMVTGKVTNPTAAKRHILERRPLTNERSKLEIKVYVVYQNVKKTSLSVKKAEKILKDCAEGFEDCQIILTQVNPTPTPYVFTDSDDSFKSITGLLSAASNQKWLDEADIIIGVIGDERPNLGGWALIGQCFDQYYARALIIREDMPDYVLAHEIGHNLGMTHDNTPNTLMQEAALLTLPKNMSLENKSCYHSTTNCKIKGVDYFELYGKATILGNTLAWSPKNEIENEGFWVERRAKNFEWETLDFVKSKGASTAQNYTFFDKTIEESTFYRIRYKNLAGNDIYSNDVVIVRKGDLGIQLGQNPFSENLQILLDVNAKTLTINVFDCLGRFCFSQNLEGGQNELNFNSFPKGVYFLQFKKENKTEILRVIKSF